MMIHYAESWDSIGKRKIIISRAMHSQSDSDMLIVRVRGPWGISRIKCHKNDSLADLKRYTSERVLGLPRSSTSIAFFRDQNCSQLYHGDNSSTLRRLKVENDFLQQASSKLM